MSMNVKGTVRITNGTALLELTPAAPPRRDMKPRPSPEDIAGKVKTGIIHMHPSRLPVTREMINSCLATVQRKLRLTTGMLGEWTEAADELLASNLAAPKRGSVVSSPKVARPLLALPPPSPAPLAIEAEASPPSDSDSSDSSDEMASVPQKRKLSSGSSSSSSSSSSTPKATLRQRIEELTKEQEEFVDAISCHQEIEELCDNLIEENNQLRLRLAQ